jgi:acyl-CoA synthetase (AMP-forming)/AMP-acid ligase II
MSSTLLVFNDDLMGRQNLFPVQIENALLTNESIREAATISVPNTTYGEVVGAWIIRQPGTNITRQDVRRTVINTMNPQARAKVFRVLDKY